MPNFEGLVSLKRKKYWVTRWIEITSTTFQYRNSKDDLIKRQYKLNTCNIEWKYQDKMIIIQSNDERFEIKIDSDEKYQQIANMFDKNPYSIGNEIADEQQTMLVYNKNQQEINFWNQIDENEDRRDFLQYYDNVQQARQKFESQLIEQVNFFNLHEKFKFFTEIILVGGETTLQTGGEAIINCDKKQVLNIISNKSNYDNFIAEESTIKELNQELKIVNSTEVILQNTIKLAFPYQNRSLILLRRLYDENEITVLVDKSLEDLNGLQINNSLFSVRANLLVSGWKLRGFANGSTLVSFASQIQFKGTLDQHNKLFKNYIYEQKYSSEQAKWLPKIAEMVQT